MPYTPNATDIAEPVAGREILTAAQEFRTLKSSVNERINTLTVGLAVEGSVREAVDNALAVKVTALEQLAFNGSTPGTVVKKQFTATAGQTVFTLDFAPITVASIDVYIQGVYQNADTYTVAGAVITLSEAQELGTLVEIVASVPLQLGETSADAVEYLPVGTGAVSTTVQSKLRESVSVLDFYANGVSGAPVDPTGVIDSTAGIQAAFSSAVQKVIIPNGTYKITAPLLLDGKKYIEGFGADVGTSVIRLENDAVLEVVKVGSVATFSGGIKNLSVDRVAYSGSTENIGYAFYDMAGALVESISSRYSKYNFYFKPTTGKRVAYNTLINLSGVGGFYNMTGLVSGTGFFNENVFIGGRMFTTSDTNSNVYFNTPLNGNRWIAMSCEGSGQQAFYLDSPGPSLGTHSNVIYNCRTEGTWAIDDIVLGQYTQLNTVDSRSLYTSVTDAGSANVLFTGTINKLTTAANETQPLKLVRQGANTTGVAVLEIDDQGSGAGNSLGVLVKSGRDTAAGSIIRGVRRSDNLLRFDVTSDGGLFASKSVWTGQAGWNFFPLKMGTWTFWVNDNRVWKKNGEPTSASDGVTIDSDHVTATAANIASAAATINTTNKFAGKLVWDVTNNRMMRTVGATSTSVWWVVDGSASVTPI